MTETMYSFVYQSHSLVPYIERGENQCIPYIAPAAPQLFHIAAKREISNTMETRTQIFRIRAEKQAAL